MRAWAMLAVLISSSAAAQPASAPSASDTIDERDHWLAADLKTAGVKKLTGRLVIDDTFFDADDVPPDFDQKNEDAAHRAPVSAASLNYNAVTVWVQPGAKAGAPARVVFDPPSAYFKL